MQVALSDRGFGTINFQSGHGKNNPKEVVQLKNSPGGGHCTHKKKSPPKVKNEALTLWIMYIPVIMLRARSKKWISEEAPVNMLKAVYYLQRVVQQRIGRAQRSLLGLGKDYWKNALKGKLKRTGIKLTENSLPTMFSVIILGSVRNTHNGQGPEDWIRKQDLGKFADVLLPKSLKEYELKY